MTQANVQQDYFLPEHNALVVLKDCRHTAYIAVMKQSCSTIARNHSRDKNVRTRRSAEGRITSTVRRHSALTEIFCRDYIQRNGLALDTRRAGEDSIAIRRDGTTPYQTLNDSAVSMTIIY